MSDLFQNLGIFTDFSTQLESSHAVPDLLRESILANRDSLLHPWHSSPLWLLRRRERWLSIVLHYKRATIVLPNRFDQEIAGNECIHYLNQIPGLATISSGQIKTRLADAFLRNLGALQVEKGKNQPARKIHKLSPTKSIH